MWTENTAHNQFGYDHYTYDGYTYELHQRPQRPYRQEARRHASPASATSVHYGWLDLGLVLVGGLGTAAVPVTLVYLANLPRLGPCLGYWLLAAWRRPVPSALKCPLHGHDVVEESLQILNCYEFYLPGIALFATMLALLFGMFVPGLMWVMGIAITVLLCLPLPFRAIRLAARLLYYSYGLVDLRTPGRLFRSAAVAAFKPYVTACRNSGAHWLRLLCLLVLGLLARAVLRSALLSDLLKFMSHIVCSLLEILAEPLYLLADAFHYKHWLRLLPNLLIDTAADFAGRELTAFPLQQYDLASQLYQYE